MSLNDLVHMQRALSLAQRGIPFARPNPCVGAVIVNQGKVVGEGYHQAFGGPHAEVFALESAGDAARGATCYVTLEPCNHTGKTPPCVDALLKAGIARVVIAAKDPFPEVNGQGIARLRAHGVIVESGLLALNARHQNKAFHHHLTRQTPYIVIKSAMSLDGRTAKQGGKAPYALTSEAVRHEVHRMRSESDVLITGIGTILADDPLLNVRLPCAEHLSFRPPLRVIVDTHLRTPPTARLFDVPGTVIIATCSKNEQTDLQKRAQIWVLPEVNGQVSLKALISRLSDEGLRQIMVESGPRLQASFLSQRLADEWVVFMAPKLLGHEAWPLAFIGPDMAPKMVYKSTQLFGEDLCVRYEVCSQV
ncbi:MAG: bifunctional diaminohydroxyphosphoribosylaminopyrimidine deaminase/5-amino-6-(5-phosphoribosylamino)uracil reductase RibD [Gammaproteobacteria bacterium]